MSYIMSSSQQSFFQRCTDWFDSKSSSECIYGGSKSVIYGARAVSIAASTAKIFWTIGVLAEKTLRWIGTAGRIIYPVTCIDFGMHYFSVLRFSVLYGRLQDRKFFKDERSQAENECIFRYIQKKSATITASFELGKKSERLLKNISLTEVDSFTEELAIRARKKITIDILRTCIKIMLLVASGLSVFGVTAPAVGVITGIFVVASVGLYCIERALCPKNLFDKRNPIERSISWIDKKKKKCKEIAEKTKENLYGGFQIASNKINELRIDFSFFGKQ